MPEKALLNIKNIYKSFGLNAVLKGISLDVNEGEVLALIGGNGAGKSTLMKIIMGIYQHDSGEIYVKGEKVASNKTSAALASGIYMVPQEPLLFPNMTVEENIEIGFDKNKAELHKELVQVMKDVGWNLDLNRKASSLSIAEQQIVEILRGLLRHAQILILDEPTSALTFDEVESLFKCVNELKEKGIGIIYITHRLAEVFEIATDVAIMRDGKIPVQGKVEEFTREMLVKGLLPPDAQDNSSAAEKQEKKVDYTHLKPVFEVQHLSGYGFTDISLKVYPGEILGLAGVVGAGRTELATTIFGKDKVLNGKVILDGKDITGLSTRKVIEAGLNYVPEDRHAHGLFKISDVAYNTSSAMLAEKPMGRFILNTKEEYNMTQKYIDDFRIKVTGQSQLVGSLSGGNQQKIVIGRSLTTSPKLVILDEPTRGIDAAARGDVYTIIHQLREQGVAVLLISSDMEEIVELSDRVMTVCQGRINGEFMGEDINQDTLMSASFGITKNSEVGA
ncbi:MAG: sugar ABC transporter ATP-binding protein [Clostridia bacterium]|nr:sugar ABC transporter ATP-binding protein [Clostridia bacterium]MDY5555512.1 sugar ABC transporter ATP-binding protein [Blautia sp.]